jgi:hypothetical protein
MPMLWEVAESGRVEVRLRAYGAEVNTAKIASDRLIGNIITDLSSTLNIDVLSDELRYSFSKTQPEVTVIWRTHVPVERVAEVRAYLDGLAKELK